MCRYAPMLDELEKLSGFGKYVGYGGLVWYRVRSVGCRLGVIMGLVNIQGECQQAGWDLGS